jgi:molecular chaperone DnaJ
MSGTCSDAPALPTYYDVLGIGTGASQADVRSAYRKLAVKHHPDKNAGGAAAFNTISEAYQVLSDPEKRADYDRGEFDDAAFEFSDASEMFDSFFGAVLGSGFFAVDDGALSQLFEAPEVRLAMQAFASMPKTASIVEGLSGLATGTRAETVVTCIGSAIKAGLNIAASRARRSKDIVLTLRVELDDVYRGILKKVKVRRIRFDARGAPALREDPFIVALNASSTVFRSEADDVADGHRGDLVINVAYKPHALFKVDGNNLAVVKRVSAYEAFAGSTFYMTHLSGELLRIHAARNIWKHPVQVLRGEGLPDRRNVRGDVFVYFAVDDVDLDAASVGGAFHALFPPVRDDGFIYDTDRAFVPADLEFA